MRTSYLMLVKIREHGAQESTHLKWDLDSFAILIDLAKPQI